MKNLYTIAVLVISAAALANAQPTEKKEVKIGIVELQKCFGNYNKAKEVGAQIMEKQLVAAKEAEKKSQQQKAMSADLKKISEVLSNPSATKEEKEAKMKERDKLIATAQPNKEAAETAQKEIEALRASVVDAVKAAVAAQAKEDGYTQVLEKAAIAYSEEADDITDKVIERLNKDTASKTETPKTETQKTETQKTETPKTPITKDKGPGYLSGKSTITITNTNSIITTKPLSISEPKTK